MRNDLMAAVEYFEMVERNNGPDAMVHFGPVARMEMLRQYKLARTALAALREKQQRQPDPDTGCPECSWIDPALSDCNYCKNCGRRLRDALIERTEVEG